MRRACRIGVLVCLLTIGAAARLAAQEAPPPPEVTAAGEAEAAEAGAQTSAPETAGEEETGTPEITMEVVGKREGLLSISPAPGEAVSEVSATAIAETAAATVMEAIELVPSVVVRHQGARYENRLSIRGQAPRLVLLDGIPIAREGYTGPGGGAGGAETSFAGRILYTMPAEMIERIDVIRTGNTIVYGPAASAGAVINIVTKDPGQGSQVAGTVEYGSFDRRRVLLDAGSSDGRLGFYVLGGAEYAGSHLPLGEKRFSNAFGKMFYHYPDGSRLFLEYFWLDGSRTLDLSQDFSIVPPRYWTIYPWRERFTNFVYSKALSEVETLDIVSYQRARDFFTQQYTNETFSVVSQDWLESQDDVGVDLRYSVRHDAGRMTRAGLQWSNLQTAARQTQYRGPAGPLPRPKVTDTSQEYSIWSAFLNQVWPLSRGVRASLGARLDDRSDAAPDITFSAGLEASPSPGRTWYVSVGTGAEHPEPSAGDVEKGIVPAEASSVSAEIGCTVRPDEARAWTTALFWTRTQDARVLYNDPPGAIGPLAWVSKAEDITTYGLELTYQQRVHERLSWFANYLYLREDVTNHNPPPIPGPTYPFLPEPPKHVVAAGIRATVGGARLALSAKYVGDHWEQNRLMKTAAPVDSYLVFDFTARCPFGPGELVLAIDNLLDADYETMPAFPRPGRNYLIGYRRPW